MSRICDRHRASTLVTLVSMLAPTLAGRLLVLAALAAVVTAGGCGKEAPEGKTTGQPAASAEAGAAAAPRPASQSRQPIEPPRDVSASPADAQKTASGLAYVVLTQGIQDRKPGINDTVRIHFTAWPKSGETRVSTPCQTRPR